MTPGMYGHQQVSLQAQIWRCILCWIALAKTSQTSLHHTWSTMDSILTDPMTIGGHDHFRYKYLLIHELLLRAAMRSLERSRT